MAGEKDAKSAEENNPNNGNNAPKDKYMLSYIIFYWLGMGSLLPWNFFISGKLNYHFKRIFRLLCPH